VSALISGKRRYKAVALPVKYRERTESLRPVCFMVLRLKFVGCELIEEADLFSVFKTI